jgi:hypothetical protein
MIIDILKVDPFDETSPRDGFRVELPSPLRSASALASSSDEDDDEDDDEEDDEDDEEEDEEEDEDDDEEDNDDLEEMDGEFDAWGDSMDDWRATDEELSAFSKGGKGASRRGKAGSLQEFEYELMIEGGLYKVHNPFGDVDPSRRGENLAGNCSKALQVRTVLELAAKNLERVRPLAPTCTKAIFQSSFQPSNLLVFKVDDVAHCIHKMLHQTFPGPLLGLLEVIVAVQSSNNNTNNTTAIL